MEGTTDPQVSSTSIDAPEELTRADVENVMTTLVKAVRATQIYQANNPVLQRFKTALHSAFDDLWAKTDVLELKVQENGFRWDGHTFEAGEGRENMGFLFYKDGIRYLTFLPGFEKEILAFLTIIQKARQLKREQSGEDDLITLLWEQDFEYFQYGYVDLLAEGLAVPEGGDLELVTVDTSEIESEVAETTAATSRAQTEEESEEAQLQGLSREDFEETLYFLDPSELAKLQEEVQLEMERDLRTDVLNALFDRLEDDRPGRREEILQILSEFLPILLRQGDLRSAAALLRELETMRGTGTFSQENAARVDGLFDKLSEPAVVRELVRILERGHIPADSEDLGLFFSRLKADALPVLLRAHLVTEDHAVQARIGSAVRGLARENPQKVVEMLAEEDDKVVEGAASLAGDLGLSNAVDQLQATLSRPGPSTRLAAVEALVAIRTTTALNALMTALTDPDREVRIAAVRGIGAVKYPSARERLLELIEEKEFKEADLTEKIAVFEALGSIGGSQVVERLAGILNHKGFLGRRNPSDMRACAALGLGKAATPEARAALNEASDEEDPVVRNAVLRGLRPEQEAS